MRLKIYYRVKRFNKWFDFREPFLIETSFNNVLPNVIIGLAHSQITEDEMGAEVQISAIRSPGSEEDEIDMITEVETDGTKCNKIMYKKIGKKGTFSIFEIKNEKK